jgi:hypothetical protein
VCGRKREVSESISFMNIIMREIATIEPKGFTILKLCLTNRVFMLKDAS